MPAYDKIRERWRCKVCGLEYVNEAYAFSCEQSHERVLVEFDREDLMRLTQFLFNPDPALLTESLMRTLMPYRNNMKGLAPKRK